MNINQGGVRFRQEGALQRLQDQLVSGTKPLKSKSAPKNATVPLTDTDIKRIQKEIAVLNSRIQFNQPKSI